LHSVFKSHKFKPQGELNVDSFKEHLEMFVKHVQGKHSGKIIHGSFEDIKEQDNDDSLYDKSKASKSKPVSGQVLPFEDNDKPT
jgi:hypothetical protein